MKPSDPDNIAETLRIRTSVLDGATATMLAEATAAAHLPLADLLCLEHPKNVEALHKAYLDAGADIISTNTFNANALILEKFYHAKHPSMSSKTSTAPPPLWRVNARDTPPHMMDTGGTSPE